MYQIPDQSNQDSKEKQTADTTAASFHKTYPHSFWRMSDYDISEIRATQNNAPPIVLGGGTKSNQIFEEKVKRYKL